MGLALEEAKKALEIDEVPIGAIVVKQNKIVGKGFNKREYLQKPTAHAEIIAIDEAAKNSGSWRLNDMRIYVTMEPCAMCAGALILARLKTVIFAIRDPKGGACGTVFNIANEPLLNHRLEIIEGVRETEARSLIQNFFRKKREKAKSLN